MIQFQVIDLNPSPSALGLLSTKSMSSRTATSSSAKEALDSKKLSICKDIGHWNPMSSLVWRFSVAEHAVGQGDIGAMHRYDWKRREPGGSCGMPLICKLSRRVAAKLSTFRLLSRNSGERRHCCRLSLRNRFQLYKPSLSQHSWTLYSPIVSMTWNISLWVFLSAVLPILTLAIRSLLRSDSFTEFAPCLQRCPRHQYTNQLGAVNFYSHTEI